VYSLNEPGDGYRLATVSGDGKVLIWTLQNRLCNPVEGYRLTATSNSTRSSSSRSSVQLGSTAALGCTALSFPAEGKLQSSLIAGSEGGALLRCNVLNSTVHTELGTAAAASSTGSWSTDALQLLQHISSTTRRSDVKRTVDDYARGQRLKRVTLDTVFAAKPDVNALYSAPQPFLYERHNGPITAVDASPFHRSLFLSCGIDGVARVYSALQSKALLELQPSESSSSSSGSSSGTGGALHSSSSSSSAVNSSALLDCAWSKARPLVFAAAAADGAVYVYDLGSSLIAPTAQVCVCLSIY
jgi:WD repeat-containing protein 34